MEWKTAGEKPAVVPALRTLDPRADEKYQELTKYLESIHNLLIKEDLAENPALIGNYLGELRLGANRLFSWHNRFLEELSDLQRANAGKRQALFTHFLQEKSPNAAEILAKEMSREDDGDVKVLESRIQRVKNDYERYNSICMYLQSRLKEFNVERMLG